MKKAGILFIIIVVVFLTFFIIFFKENRESNIKTEAVQSAPLGIQWILNNKEKISDPSALVVMKMINDEYCHSPETDKFLKEEFKKFDFHNYFPVFERLFYDGQDYKISGKALKILKSPPEPYNPALSQTLYCDIYPLPENFAKNVFDNLEKETGYDLTHKFWSAIILKNNGCSIPGYDLDKIISSGAEKIAEEQDKNKQFDDLYAERTAFLMQFGFKDMVKKEWLENILKNQKTSGAWETPSLGENPHTTALAVWALSAYAQTCP